ncbi:MAG: DUF6151 family protein [Cyanobacteria bacterium P01_F01_bin.53]
MADIPLQCGCGKVKGIAHDISPRTGTRVVCYCDDCQAFARFLDGETTVLDEYGGTDIFQIAPAQVEITAGAEYLSSMRLSPKGLIRWYSQCCKTSIGNTISGAIPFVGLVNSFIHDDCDSEQERLRYLNEILGPVKFYVHGKFAQKPPLINNSHQSIQPQSIQPQTIHDGEPLQMLIRAIPKLLLAKVRGQGQPSPFFDIAGTPVSQPIIHTPKP